MKQIVIEGKAENSKAGAIVFTSRNEIYYLQGIQSWPDSILGKNIEIKSYLNIYYQPEENLKNSKGEYSQSNSGEIKQIKQPKWKLIEIQFQNDKMLQSLKNLFPNGWILKFENKNLVIYCTSQAYCVYENKINANIMNETNSEKELRFKRFGKLINCQFIFMLKNKLSDSEIYEIKTKNQKILKSIEIHKENLKDIPICFKDGNFLPRNSVEKKRIADFFAEKKNLSKQIIKLPDYISEYYSLYLLSENGLETEFISIFPEKYSFEMFHIKNEVLKKALLHIE